MDLCEDHGEWDMAMVAAGQLAHPDVDIDSAVQIYRRDQFQNWKLHYKVRPQGQSGFLASKTVPFFSKTPPFRAVLLQGSSALQTRLGHPAPHRRREGRGAWSAGRTAAGLAPAGPDQDARRHRPGGGSGRRRRTGAGDPVRVEVDHADGGEQVYIANGHSSRASVAAVPASAIRFQRCSVTTADGSPAEVYEQMRQQLLYARQTRQTGLSRDAKLIARCQAEVEK